MISPLLFLFFPPFLQDYMVGDCCCVIIFTISSMKISQSGKRTICSAAKRETEQSKSKQMQQKTVRQQNHQKEQEATETKSKYRSSLAASSIRIARRALRPDFRVIFCAKAESRELLRAQLSTHSRALSSIFFIVFVLSHYVCF